MPQVDRLDRPVDDGQRAQAQEVELDQADRLDVVLVELGDRVATQAIVVVFGEQRAEGVQWFGCDHHAAGVLAGVAGQVLQLARQVDQVAYVFFGSVALDQLGRGHLALGAALAFAHRIGQRDAQDVGHQLGHAIDEAVGEAEHAPGVAQHRLGGHGAVGDDLADPVTAVLAGHVVDHLVAPVHAEVDVEVGHRHAFGIEEALEQQVVGQRVQVGDLQRPGHQRAGTRAAARADRDALVLAPLDEVGHDQEVAGKPHLDDGVELEIQPLDVVLAAAAFGQRVLRQPCLQARVGLGADPAVQGFIAGHRVGGQGVLAQGQFQVAAPGQVDGVGDRIGHVGEQLRHLRGRLQVLLVAVVARAPGIVQHPARSDAHPRLVRVEAIGVQEAHIVGRHHRNRALGRGVQGKGIEGVLALAPGAGQLQAKVVAEAALPVGQLLPGQVLAVFAGQASGQAFAAGQQDQPLRVLAQPFRPHRHPAFAAMALHPGPGEQVRQLQVAAMVAAQRGDPPRRLARPGGHGQVGAGDGLDPDRLGRLVELDQGEQVVEVGDRQRRQPQLDCTTEQVGQFGLGRIGVVGFFRHADGRVRERKLGVQVEVDEGGHARSRVPAGWEGDKA